MMTDGNNFVAQTQERLSQFWGETLQVVWQGDHAFLAYPLMLPDGVQIVFELRPTTATTGLLTDGGQIASRLAGDGLNLESESTSRLLDEKLAFYNIQRDGFELLRPISLPVDPVEVQVYAEGLLAVAHLINRHEPEANEESVARRSIERLFASRHLAPRRNHVLQGRLEQSIRVNYFIESKKALALEVVERKTNLHGYMQQWGWRWSDLKLAHPTIRRAMIYDPDRQDWDSTALEIGRSVCDVFCPYHESAILDDALAAATE